MYKTGILVYTPWCGTRQPKTTHGLSTLVTEAAPGSASEDEAAEDEAMETEAAEAGTRTVPAARDFEEAEASTSKPHHTHKHKQRRSHRKRASLDGTEATVEASGGSEVSSPPPQQPSEGEEAPDELSLVSGKAARDE